MRDQPLLSLLTFLPLVGAAIILSIRGDKALVDRNARNVCGVAPVYVTLRLGTGSGPGELVRYGQGRIDPESGSVVSYAAVAFAD